MNNLTTNPPHYKQHPSGIECIQITRHMSFNLGNVIKYVWRADLKHGIEDLEKAVWYLQDEIKTRKEKINQKRDQNADYNRDNAKVSLDQNR